MDYPLHMPHDIESHTRRNVIMLDVLERLLIMTLYVFLVVRIVGSMREGGHLVNGLLLVSEGLVILFLLIRRPTSEVSFRPRVWFLAIVATCGPLLVTPSLGTPLASPVVGMSIWLFGTLLQVSAKLALGRSFGCIPAHRGLKLCGPYRWLRHPMYAGYVLSHVAFLLMNPSLGNLAIYMLCDAVQVPRMLFEEQFLGRDPAYLAYCRDVKWRVVPGLF